MELLSDERKHKILNLIDQHGKVSVRQLALDFNVSTETVRRDLDELATKNLLKKVYGGALRIETTRNEPTIMERNITNQVEKKRIGEQAASITEDGDVIFIDEGSTTLQMIPALVGKSGLMVITNFFPIVKALMEYEQKKQFDGDIIFLGGHVHSAHGRTGGSFTKTMAQSFFPDKAFISLDGIEPKIGMTGYHSEKCSLSELFIYQAKQVYALADHSKLGVTANYKIESLTAFDHVICNADAPANWDIKGLDWITC
ncbi:MULTISPECIES: DeoR/GlpR family DNA-binding transcription regulator [Virgibacillus]|uniref:DeoR family transcriptional regulator n=1 Tax=Virgibacillus kapii TaxID=1638645 RepID=A0ABQ2DXA6_9BACI|nr:MULTISPECIES: DeoR/GlpR family DNA-binding transcription regulator [Virgibacillus]EQB35341.1 hypothetical protein M948_19770 [Virgibacillus sp. CM-4]MYL42633.1 DeoR family transcriptional regulator [Virgibacillus massiliensis]GGJ75645.1 DeoR family transcriptional regulator [Virgibacillus kapii]